MRQLWHFGFKTTAALFISLSGGVHRSTRACTHAHAHTLTHTHSEADEPIIAAACQLMMKGLSRPQVPECETEASLSMNLRSVWLTDKKNKHILLADDLWWCLFFFTFTFHYASLWSCVFIITLTSWKLCPALPHLFSARSHPLFPCWQRENARFRTWGKKQWARKIKRRSWESAVQGRLEEEKDNFVPFCFCSIDITTFLSFLLFSLTFDFPVSFPPIFQLTLGSLSLSLHLVRSWAQKERRASRSLVAIFVF